jgi:hypothetical protein
VVPGPLNCSLSNQGIGHALCGKYMTANRSGN